ncbi:Hpt domain-containing protein [Thalassoroseus pseudoceratinae]|uniref:Hpt domain-containing protein n=1 Tax=Thalassoroseus pseudoceratinae TaxID=2713176 RepID=UPI001420AEF1|nr:Hpt domain-containing protein [Thalassoroseus pseudoceratinae]
MTSVITILLPLILTIAISVIDWIMPSDVVGGTAYVLPVALSFAAGRRFSMLSAGVCTALIWLVPLLSGALGDRVVLANRLLAMFAVWIVAVMTTRVGRILQLSTEEVSPDETDEQPSSSPPSAASSKESDALAERLAETRQELEQVRRERDQSLRSTERSTLELDQIREELERASAELQQTRQTAGAAVRTQQEFLHQLSRQIEVPAETLVASLDDALATELSEAQRESLQTVSVSAGYLQDVLRNMLDLAKLEVGTLELQPEEFSLRDELESLFRNLATHPSHPASTRWLIDWPNSVPAAVVGDVDRLRRLFLDLIGPGVARNPGGAVVLTVETDAEQLGSRSPEPGEVLPFRFRLNDTHSDGYRPRPALAEKLSSHLGGDLKLNNGSDGSREFELTLQLPIGHSPPAETVSPDWVGTPVLIVDNNAAARRVLARMLQDCKLLPTTAAAGFEALETWRQAKREGREFSLVVVDADLDDVSATSLADRLRKDRGFSGHVVLLRNVQEAPTQSSEYLLKPFRRDEVHAMITAALKTVERPALQMESEFASPNRATTSVPGLRQPSVPLEKNTESLDSSRMSWPKSQRLDWAAALQEAGGSRERLQEAIDSFLEACPRHLHTLRMAIALEDSESIERTSQAIGHVARMVGGIEIAPLADQLEQKSRHGRLDEAPALWDALRSSFENLAEELNDFLMLEPTK